MAVVNVRINENMDDEDLNVSLIERQIWPVKI